MSQWRGYSKEFARMLRFTAECVEYYCKVSSFGDCNNCGVRKNCQYAPKLGEMVRINCPLWQEREVEK